jgi:hypothetical protein
MKIKLDLPFKGARDYVHFPDLYGAIRPHLEAIAGPPEAFTRLRMLFHRPLLTEGLLELLPDGAGSPKAALPADACLEIVAQTGRGSWYGWVRATGEPIARREADREAIISSLVRVEEREVFLARPSGEPAMEELIVLGKAFMQQRGGAARTRSYKMVKIDLRRPVLESDAGKMRLLMEDRMMMGFFRARLVAAEGELGGLMGYAVGEHAAAAPAATGGAAF